MTDPTLIPRADDPAGAATPPDKSAPTPDQTAPTTRTQPTGGEPDDQGAPAPAVPGSGHAPQQPGPGPEGTSGAPSPAAAGAGREPSDQAGPAQAGVAAGAGPAGHAPLPAPLPHAGARYALLRFTMLLTVGGVLYLIGVRGWLLIVLAFLLSGVVSYFVLMRQRDAAAANLERTVQGWSARRRSSEYDEDD